MPCNYQQRYELYSAALLFASFIKFASRILLHSLSVELFSHIKMYPESQITIVCNKQRVLLQDRDVSKCLPYQNDFFWMQTH